MAGSRDSKNKSADWRPATKLVHEGTLRSQFGETSEAIFLNSGYVYQSAEQAEARFKGDEEGFVYSRYANPTVAMFEARMCALEGAPAARGTASGMAASTGWPPSDVHAATRCQCVAWGSPGQFSGVARPREA